MSFRPGPPRGVSPSAPASTAGVPVECVHTVMASDDGKRGNESHVAWAAQADWFRSHGYRIRRCPGCNRYAVVVSEDGRRVRSFLSEVRFMSDRG